MQVDFTTCGLQRPEKFIVTVTPKGITTDESFHLAQQTVMGMWNEYTLEELDLGQKYQVSIILGGNVSSSVPTIANFCK